MPNAHRSFICSGSLQRLLTYCKLFSALALLRPSDKLTPADIAAYSSPPLPAANAFIKKRAAEAPPASGSGADAQRETPRPHARHAVRPRALIPHLLAARQRACAALTMHLRAGEDQELLGYLVSKGARVP